MTDTILRCHDSHTPSKQITYDAGNEQSIWHVCKDCFENKDCFRKNIITIKELEVLVH